MLRSCATLLFAGALLAQQEIVHYAFDNTDTTQVLNYARGPLAAPPFGTTTWPASFTWTTGRYGSALSASMYMGGSGFAVDSGWSGTHQGALTIAFYLRNQLANTPAAYSPIAGQPGWSIATGGSAGAGLQLRGWGGPDLNADFGVNVCAMTGWNHFALVVDPQAGSATWYRNGAAAVTTPIAGGVALGGGAFVVGRDLINICGSFYDIDEFRMLGRAASGTEIASWATEPSAAVQTFGTSTGIVADTQSVPSLGNLAFAVGIHAQASTGFAFVAGFSYARHGAQNLPIDLGTMLGAAAGQQLRVAPQVSTFGVIAGGEGQVAIGIPANTGLLGVQLFGQAIGLTPANGIETSNAIALRVGR